MQSSHFSTEFINFFKDLSTNNTSEWFNANKKEYESAVKKPFERFVEDFIAMCKGYDKRINMTAKEATFRINRDTRFLKDKSPYKTNMSAAVSEGGKNPGYPGLYIELSHEGVTLIGGAYTVEKENLLKLRHAIVSDLKGFQKLKTDKKFVERFGKIEGEKYKLLPEEFRVIAAKEPLIANKQFYFSAKLPTKLITDAKLLKTIEEYYLAARPLNQFLIKGLF